MYARGPLLTVLLFVLTAIFVAWLFRGGHVRPGRLFIVTIGAIGLLAVLARRMGWEELGIIAILVLAPAMFVPSKTTPRNPPRRTNGRRLF
jgi:hypothetical protein